MITPVPNQIAVATTLEAHVQPNQPFLRRKLNIKTTTASEHPKHDKHTFDSSFKYSPLPYLSEYFLNAAALLALSSLLASHTPHSPSSTTVPVLRDKKRPQRRGQGSVLMAASPHAR